MTDCCQNNKKENRRRLLKTAGPVGLLCFCVLLTAFVCVRCSPYTKVYEYRDMVRQCADEADVPVYTVLAMIRVESNFDPDAQSGAGAMGIMQVMPKTAEWCCGLMGIAYEEERLFDPQYNTAIGCHYLRYLLDKLPFDWAIVAYNAGEGKVYEWIRQGLRPDEVPYKESREYLAKVSAWQKKYTDKRIMEK